MSWQGWGTGLAIFPPRQICSVALEADVIIEFDVVTEQWMDKLEINGICKLAIVSRFCRKPKKKKRQYHVYIKVLDRWRILKEMSCFGRI